MMTRRAVLLVVYVVLASIGCSYSQTARSFVDASRSQQDIERDIITYLEKAKELLQSTVNARVDPLCKAQVVSAIRSLASIESFLLQDEYAGAREQLSSAQKSLKDSTNLRNFQEHRSALLYLIDQSMSHIENANNLLLWLLNQKEKLKGTYNPPVAINDGKQLFLLLVTSSAPCKVDGTICQFSECGKGKSLPACSLGFAAGVVGGANGQTYVVTSPLDDPKSPEPGTLRHGVSLGGTDTGVWIIFSANMTIHLNDMLWVRSMTTIDGRGWNVTITGRNVVLAGVSNVILHNFQVSSVGESDTVHIFSGCKKVWVDHISSWDARLGLVSVLQGSTDVTISNSFLSNPGFNMLLGASDSDTEDRIMRVTVYRNWFKDSTQRMPHCRWGYCHVVNNLYTDWEYYAIGGRVNAKIQSDSNVFIAGRRSEVTPWFYGNNESFDTTASITSSNDLFLNGSTFHQFPGVEPTTTTVTTLTTLPYPSPDHNPPVHPTSTLPLFVEKCAGALFGEKLQHCMFVASSTGV